MRERHSVLVVLGFAIGLFHCGGGVVSDTGGCPCTAQTGEGTLTLSCGESLCASTGTDTVAYSCTESGLTQTIDGCDIGLGVDGGHGRDGGADGSRGRDSGARGDATTGRDVSAPDAPTASDAPTIFPFDVSQPLPDASEDAGLPDVAVIGTTGVEAGCVSRSDATVCSDAGGCDCFAQETCVLSCSANQGDAGLTVECPQAQLCDIGCAGSCDVECTQAQICGVNVGGGSTVTCTQAQDCTGNIGGDASVDCTQAIACNVAVGSGTMVDCTQAQSCGITCNGSCAVNCTQAEACAVTCPAGAACSVYCDGIDPVSPCSDGKTYVCGSSLCPGASADAGF